MGGRSDQHSDVKVRRNDQLVPSPKMCWGKFLWLLFWKQEQQKTVVDRVRRGECMATHPHTPTEYSHRKDVWRSSFSISCWNNIKFRQGGRVVRWLALVCLLAKWLTRKKFNRFLRKCWWLTKEEMISHILIMCDFDQKADLQRVVTLMDESVWKWEQERYCCLDSSLEKREWLSQRKYKSSVRVWRGGLQSSLQRKESRPESSFISAPYVPTGNIMSQRGLASASFDLLSTSWGGELILTLVATPSWRRVPPLSIHMLKRLVSGTPREKKKVSYFPSTWWSFL